MEEYIEEIICDNLDIEDFQGNEFDIVIGHIEDILVDENFQVEMVSNFMEKHWMTFENTEENKLTYTDVFTEYTMMIENYITVYLSSKIPNFSMKSFLCELEERKDNLDGEIFDILFTMSDFLKFKEIILDFRNVKEGIVADLNLNSCITNLNI